MPDTFNNGIKRLLAMSLKLWNPKGEIRLLLLPNSAILAKGKDKVVSQWQEVHRPPNPNKGKLLSDAMKSAPTISNIGSDKSVIQLKYGVVKPGPVASKNESEKGRKHSNQYFALQEENFEEVLVNGESNGRSMEEEQISNGGTAIHSVAGQSKAGSIQDKQISKGENAINAVKIISPYKETMGGSGSAETALVVPKGDCPIVGMAHAQDTPNNIEGELVVDLSHSDFPVATAPHVVNPAPIPHIPIVESKTDQCKSEKHTMLAGLLSVCLTQKGV
ncbi:hypothetical protein QJS04_geneDACA022609 [Acorus gramineus]|uniref:Uncharacterized protein n=1 Tax=Acorus gramineus TaxID=55184 RepID=A0AAV9BUA8_ACOGR|nr:hypothetical protein QJS04_geneDACA022609 [Acorus gramineus]